MQHNPIIHPVNNFGYNKYINFINNQNSNSFNPNQNFSNAKTTPQGINNLNIFQNNHSNSMNEQANSINNYDYQNNINLPNNRFIENNQPLPAGNNHNFNHNIYNQDNAIYNPPQNIGRVNNPSESIFLNQELTNNFKGRTPITGDRFRMAATNIIG